MYQGNQKRKVRCWFIYVILLAIVCFSASSHLEATDNRTESRSENRKPTSLQSDFEELEGSYKLEKGNANCPDGDFDIEGKDLTIGANIRILNVNGGVVKTPASSQSSCSSESVAEFDGKVLTYRDSEECSKSSKSEAKFTFDIYQSQKTKYIKMKFDKKSKISGQSTTVSFECLYSRTLK